MSSFLGRLLRTRRFSASSVDQWYFEKNAINTNQRDMQVISMVIRAAILAASGGATAGTMVGIYEESRGNPPEYKYELALRQALAGAKIGAAAVVFAPLWIPSVCIGIPLGHVYSRLNR